MASITINLRDLPKITNDRFYLLYKDEKRYNVLVGGAGSGKSVFAAQREVIKSLLSREKILCIRKVGRTLRDSVFAEIQEAINQLGVSSIYSSIKNPFEFTNLVNGSKILLLGLDDPEKIKSIKGVTREWIEEATELNEQDFDQLDLRLRGKTKHKKQITLTFNPISELHWLRKRFWEIEDKKNVTILKTTYQDNRFLDEEYKNKIRRLENQNPSLYRIYGLGEWGVIEGLVYKAPDTRTSYPESYDEIIYGLDFGYNNPTALIMFGIKDFNRKTLEGDIFIKEIIYQTGLTTTELGKLMKEKGIPSNAVIYADSAEPDRIQELHKFGFRNIKPADKGKDSVRAGISFVQSLNIHSNPDNINYNAEKQTYSWQRDKNGNWLEEPVKFSDHAMDAERYALFSHLRKPEIKPVDRKILGI